MNEAERLVGLLLDDDFDAHVKAHGRVKKWDQAHQTYRDLAGKKKKANELFQELGQGIALDRELAHNSLSRVDVADYITGERIGATDNYSRKVEMTVCPDLYCGAYRRPAPAGAEACPTCGSPLKTIEVSTPPRDLRVKYAQHIVGVKLKDGRKIWFQEPVPPKHHDWA